jgi:nucleoside-diphosphate-sugar epimerase
MTWNQYHAKVAEALHAPNPNLVHIPTDLLTKFAPNRSGITTYNFQYNNIFDNSAARRDLNFQYTIPFVEGVRRTVAFLDQNHRIQDCETDPFDDRLIATWDRLSTNMAQEIPGLDS